ncbi:MAG: alpha/beta fold hydrolase [Lewinellaceae bacterium]|nr:alpha/beta fold hydrolase [Lewinellaceae bacterium]
MEIAKDIQITGAEGRPFLLDIYYQKDGKAKPIVIFAHGFKGFKDWGHWHLIARAFAESGFVFVKFNFSHNGTTLANPLEFGDLEAFGRNNYSKELADLEAVMEWLHSGRNELPAAEASLQSIYLIGHSRGGATCAIKAARDVRVKALITWAAVSRLDYAWQDPKLMQDWEKRGVYHVINGRTGQRMPIYYGIYRDFVAKREALDVEQAVRSLNKPFLIIHGDEDPSVPVEAARQLHQWNAASTLHIIRGANHVFGGSHPYQAKELSPHAKELVISSVQFLKALEK